MLTYKVNNSLAVTRDSHHIRDCDRLILSLSGEKRYDLHHIDENWVRASQAFTSTVDI
jgi:hypothetical protein